MSPLHHSQNWPKLAGLSFLCALLAGFAAHTQAQAPVAAPSAASSGHDPSVVHVPIRPSATDPEITEFNDPEWIYFQPDIILKHDPKLPADRHQLLVFLPGTASDDGPKPPPGQTFRPASTAFSEFAATLGYHVLRLSYPNSLPAASCNNDAEPVAFENFRHAIIRGGESPRITVTRTNSIENRLIKALQYLGKKRPAEGWSEFLNEDGSLKWEAIAFSGQSQGGGHSVLLGLDHKVARVIAFGAPKDYSTALKAPSAYFARESATPMERFFTFNHEQDRQGCSPEHQIDNLRALKLDKLGPFTRVEDSAPPFQHSHALMTNYPGTKVDSLTAHGTMLSGKNKERFQEVWRYLLTE